MIDDNRTCCGYIHVKLATWIIAVIHIILATAMALNSVRQLQQYKVDFSNENWWALAINAGIALIWLLFCVILILGLCLNRASFVLPHLIVTIVVGVLFAVEAIREIAAGSNDFLHTMLLVCECVIIVLLLWIEFRCYRFLSIH